MISKEALAKGVGLLNVAYDQEPDRARLELYRETLGAILDDESWLRGVKMAISHERFFPRPAVIREYAQGETKQEQLQSAAALALEAANAYQKVIESGEYTPNGTFWTKRRVAERCGPAAAEAFVAAGGSSAFERCDLKDEPFRLKRFVEAYQEAAKSGAGRMLGEGERRALMSGNEIDQKEAAHLVDQISRAGGAR